MPFLHPVRAKSSLASFEEGEDFGSSATAKLAGAEHAPPLPRLPTSLSE